MFVYPGEEVGADGALAVDEAVLELAERGAHRVLGRPAGPVRHHVDGLPGHRVPLGDAQVVVVVLRRRPHRSALGHQRRRGRGRRRRLGHWRRRGGRRAVQPQPAARAERPRAGPLGELRGAPQRRGWGGGLIRRPRWRGAVGLARALGSGGGECWGRVGGAGGGGEAAPGWGRRAEQRRRERLGAPNH